MSSPCSSFACTLTDVQRTKKVFGGMKAKRGRVRPLRTDRSGIGGHIITQQEEREGESCCPDMFSYLRLAIWGSTAVRQYAIGKKEASLVASTYTKFNVTTASDGRKKHRDPHHSAMLHSGVVWSRYSNTTKDSFFLSWWRMRWRRRPLLSHTAQQKEAGGGSKPEKVLPLKPKKRGRGR